ncbi:MAG: imidazole glycerol phosphate synthase subunit HisH [Oscillospiraceae bacterium]|jgi:glutamine amidotransferase|nr:imidazole glycerol phosphate synthase subunit HisH [Oscillospiraceae bacterium]
MITVIDYGAGNLFSLCNALKTLNTDIKVTSDPTDIIHADGVFLPGVGAFPKAMRELSRKGLDTAVKEYAASGKPLFGICLGYQMLFDRSFEFEETVGLGLIHGDVRPLSDLLPSDAIIPQMGWNSLIDNTGKFGGAYMYFVHSFAAVCDNADVAAYTEYAGVNITAAAKRGNVFGTQFHPEKSGDKGLAILENFIKLC